MNDIVKGSSKKLATFSEVKLQLCSHSAMDLYVVAGFSPGKKGIVGVCGLGGVSDHINHFVYHIKEAIGIEGMGVRYAERAWGEHWVNTE